MSEIRSKLISLSQHSLEIDGPKTDGMSLWILGTQILLLVFYG